MNHKSLLKDALNALNQIPRTPLTGEYEDTYALCSAIDKHFAASAKKPDMLDGIYTFGEDDMITCPECGRRCEISDGDSVADSGVAACAEHGAFWFELEQGESACDA